MYNIYVCNNITEANKVVYHQVGAYAPLKKERKKNKKMRMGMGAIPVQLQGYQDTLYARRSNQFYCECHISGTVEFMFVDTTVCSTTKRSSRDCHYVVRGTQSQLKVALLLTTPDYGFLVLHHVGHGQRSIHANFTVNTYLGRP